MLRWQKKLFKGKIFKTIIVLIIFVLFFLASIYWFDSRGGFISLGLRYSRLKSVYKITKIFDLPYLPYLFVSDKIPVYQLKVNSQDIKKMNDALPRPEKIGDFYKILGRLESQNKVKVGAKFIFNGHEYDVKASYRGDTSDHWAWDKKSWRIDFDITDLYLGKRSINLIIADDRHYILEQFNNYRATKLGLFVPESKLVKLVINGHNYGLYWEVEQWSQEMFERAELRSDTDLYGENDVFFESKQNIFSSVLYWKKYLSNPNERLDSYGNLEQLIMILNQTDDKYFYDNIDQILDLDNFYAWAVQQELIGSVHQNWDHNIRLYWNIEIGKFQLIPWDVGMAVDLNIVAIDLHYNHLISRLMKNDEFRLERDRRLWEYVKNDNNLQDDLHYYDNQLRLIMPTLTKDFKKRDYTLKAMGEIKSIRDFIEKKYLSIRSTLAEIQIKSFVECYDDLSAIVEFTTSDHSPIIIDWSKVGGQNVYYDQDDDGVLEIEEMMVSANNILNSDRDWKVGYYGIIKIMPKIHRYFISTNNQEDFSVIIRNIISGDKKEVLLS